MIRTGLITLVAALMIADPYLCGVAEACTHCASTEASDNTHDHQPDESSDESCHSCLCQGATSSSLRHDLVAAGCCLLSSQPLLLPNPILADYCSHARHVHFGQPTTGRSIRIVLESYLA